MYEITYKTSIKPADLPEGATVKQLPREFPLSFDTHLNRRLEVERYPDDEVFLIIRCIGGDSGFSATGASVKTDVAREYALAILEAIGEPQDGEDVEVPAHVIDGDGDHWHLDTNGKYFCTGKTDRPRVTGRFPDEGEVTLGYIFENYRGFRVA